MKSPLQRPGLTGVIQSKKGHSEPSYHSPEELVAGAGGSGEVQTEGRLMGFPPAGHNMPEFLKAKTMNDPAMAHEVTGEIKQRHTMRANAMDAANHRGNAHPGKAANEL